MIVQICLALALAAPADLAKQFERDIKIVAADDMEGRGLGTKGIDRAAAFLEGRLREIKLEPAFGNSYRQPFDVKTGVEMGEGNRLSDVAADAWTPLGFSSSGKFHAPVVFCGYGIAAPPLGYDDYAGLDLKGKGGALARQRAAGEGRQVNLRRTQAEPLVGHALQSPAGARARRRRRRLRHRSGERRVGGERRSWGGPRRLK